MPEKKIEHRTVSAGIRTQATKDGKRLIGRAAAYNVLSGDLGGFRERLAPGAFRSAINRGDDVRFTFNHSANFVLGRTKAGTLALNETDDGLWFNVLLPDTQFGNDLYESVGRGDISECSFAFRCDDEDYSDETDRATGQRMHVRTVRDLHLIDCAAVAYPAYPDGTKVMARAADYVVGAATRIAFTGDDERRAHAARVGKLIAADERNADEHRAKLNREAERVQSEINRELLR